MLTISIVTDTNCINFAITNSLDFISNHCVKRGRVRSFSGLFFPAIDLNTEIYIVNHRIQSTDQKNLEYGHFLRSEYFLYSSYYFRTLQKQSPRGVL